MKIYVINGPNLNLLGTREPEIYGYETLDGLNLKIKKEFPEFEFIFFQSNHEGAVIDKLHEARDSDGVILNAGALTHYSYAVRDAVSAINIPVMEVHISDIQKREEFRRSADRVRGIAARFRGGNIRPAIF